MLVSFETIKHDENQERRDEKMRRKTVLGIVFALLLAGALATAFNFSPAKAIGTGFTIQSDGSVSPATAPVINVGNVSYTLTDNIQGSVQIYRGSILFDGAGYTLDGAGASFGIWILANYVTLRNVSVRNCDHGIAIWSNYNTVLNSTASYCVFDGIWVRGSGNVLIRNNASNNGPTQGDGIWVQSPYNVLAHNIASNNRDGIALADPVGGGAHDNMVFGNTVSSNYEYGFWLFDASLNRLFGNVISNNADHGIYIDWSAYFHDNMLYHNSFIDNVAQAYDVFPIGDTWYDNYPSGGNYWSDYVGIDEKSGPNQDQPGSDGIGDTPYYTSGPLSIEDLYPLMQPYISGTHDIGIINIEPSQTVEGLGGQVQIGVRVENQGGRPESFGVTTYAGETVVGTMIVDNLLPAANSLLTFTWNTIGLVKGNYTVSAYAWPVLNESDTLDNSMIDGTVLVTIPGDVNGDKKVDGRDIAVIAKYFGTTSGFPPNADTNDDGKIDGKDIAVAAKNFGQIWSFETMQSEMKRREAE